MEKFQRVMRHIKLISMNRRLFWMYLEGHEVDQGVVHVHHGPEVRHVQGQAHGEVQEGHEAHQINQHDQEVVLDALRFPYMNTTTPMYHMYKDRPIKKFKRVMRHIKFISRNRRLFWMHLELHEVDQGAVHVHHEPHVPHL
jgi:uncharacterized protein YlbG (UPF0298 family)